MNTNRQWLLAKRPSGLVTRANFDYAENPIPEPAEGQVLVRNLFLSFDPTQRGWMEDRPSYLPPVGIGDPMRAGSVGQVTESRHPDFAVGDIVQTTGGWQDFVVAAPNQGPMGLTKVPEGVTPRNDALRPRNHWPYRILRTAGSRRPQARRNGAGFWRCWRDRVRRRPNCTHQRLPRCRHCWRP